MLQYIAIIHWLVAKENIQLVYGLYRARESQSD